MVGKPETVTRLLELIRDGESAAQNQLLEVVYDELRQIATGLMRGERPDHTLQATALIHEAILRLVQADGLGAIENRAHFFAVVARAMREVLIEHARRRHAVRRGGNYQRVPLDDVLDHFQAQNVDLPGLHEALESLAALDPRQKQVVELRYFWGFTIEEVARELGISTTSVEGAFRKARAYLRSQLSD